MPLSLLCLGSIGTLCETSEMQREAFNQAFAEAGVDLHWDRAGYASRLARSGGAARVADFADERGLSVDVAAIHARKTEIFRRRLAEDGLELRPGVEAVLERARAERVPLALCTTTSRGNVDAILGAADLDPAIFAFIGYSGGPLAPKPAPDVYLAALRAVGVDAARAVAVEDNPDGARAALAAGIATLAFPGALHDAARFPKGIAGVAEMLEYDRLAALV